MTEQDLMSRRFSRRAALRATGVGTVGLAGAALIGCSSGDGGGGGAAKSTGTPAAAAAAGKPRFGEKLVDAMVADPPSWSPFTAANTSARMNSLAYDKLLGFTQGPGTASNATDLIPWLATALPEQPDGQTYVFKIRQGVKFQNVAPVNGRPMTTEDVKFAIDQVRNSTVFKTDFAAVTSVDAVDATTVVVKTSKPYAPLLTASVGHYGWPIFPKEMIDNKLVDSTAIGTGAYIRAEWQQGIKVVFKKNPDWWNKDLAFLNELSFLVIPDPNTTLGALKSGQLDLTSLTTSIPCEMIAGVTDKNVQRVSYPSTSQFSSFDTSKPPFNDVRVRRAISLLYNRETEAKAVYCGAAGGVTRTLGIFTQARALKPADLPEMASTQKTDIKAAKDLLTAAGHPNGFKTDIAFTPYYGANSVTALEHFISSVREGGITLNPVSFEYGRWIAEIYRPPFNWTGMCWGAGRGYPDPDQEARNWLYPGSNTNQSRVNDPAITALIDKQATQVNVNERWQTLHEIQKLEAKNHYYLWKSSGETQVLVKNKVRGFSPDSHYNSHKYMHIWVDA